jgi:crotonobetainyl-CoA:carnitine CoA-transferase CaiB-like acyl-CoA transferase
LAADPRFADFAARDQNRDELLPILREEFRKRPTADWVERLGALGVPCGPVNSVAEALADPQVEARGGLVEYEHPALGPVRQAASPLRVDGAPAPARRGPARGEHTREVLAELCGYAPDRVRALAAAGVFGDVDLAAGGK